VWGLGASGNTTTTVHYLSKKEKHTLRIWAVEPGVVIQKIMVDLGGVRYSYLGPPESLRAGVDNVGSYHGTNFAGIVVSDVG
jgi:Gylcosyl hydrolase family 115 C-terminal domain